MTCHEFACFLDPYVDSELGVDATAAATAHAEACDPCRHALERRRQWRQLLRRQPREPVPPELRERIVARVRGTSRPARLARWAVVPAVAAVLALVVVSLPARPAPIVEQLVDTHIGYSRTEWAAEFRSTDRAAIEAWFRERLRLRVAVPDLSAAGIRLVGARVTAARERAAAYIVYEKGRTPLSVFVVPLAGQSSDLSVSGRRMLYRGQAYAGEEHKGHRIVSWSDGGRLFALVSTLDYEVLLECADRLRVEHADRAA